MQQQEEKPRIFYGWFIVGACFVILAMMAGLGATFPIFLKPLSEEFEWSLVALSGAISVNMLVGGLVTPFWGNWTDRSGARVVVIVAAVMTGTCFLMLSRISALWHVYTLFIIEAAFVAGMSLIPISTTISQWFHIKRGMAMGITLSGEGLGGLIMAPLCNYLVVHTGWRNAYLLIAAIVWITVIPIAALVLRRRPEDLGLLPYGKTELPPPKPDADKREESPPGENTQTSGEGLNLKQAAGTLSFWMIATAFFLPMMAFIGITTHFVLIGEDAGMSSQQAALCLGLIAAFSIIGRFGFGYAADHFSVRGVFTFCYTVETLGVFMLLATPMLGGKALYAFVLVYGLTFGGGFALAPLIVGECFGLKALGTIFGVLAIAGTLGGAFGPTLSGLIRDAAGSYMPAFIIYSIALVIATIAISRARSALPAEKPPQQ
jgi:sugar phosphate permease